MQTVHNGENSDSSERYSHSLPDYSGVLTVPGREYPTFPENKGRKEAVEWPGSPRFSQKVYQEVVYPECVQGGIPGRVYPGWVQVYIQGGIPGYVASLLYWVVYPGM